ncbi:MAG: DNA polymerase III subunit delta [Pelagibacteraceae bacterium TMED216]|nr:MAG: DNA polymerase III subunit delta [Pelagibacteraceae bacterium TMED216]|tara:strand:- start:1422 stop:2414 length:993 start_codon:yes stop_codon:yes gene_type:complete
MIIKSFLVEKNIEELKNFKSILIYGENQGLVSDIKESLIKKLKIRPKNYFVSDFLNNKNIILNEFTNSSLFGDQDLIFLNNAEDKICDDISNLISIESQTKLIVTSGKLETKSKLRAMYEKDKNLACVPCYKDNDYTLINYAQNKLKGIDGISKEIIQYIIENSDGNRGIINSEIKKIIALSTSEKITLDKIEKLLNEKNIEEFKDLMNATIEGNKQKLNKLIGNYRLTDENLFLFLNQTSQRLLRIKQMKVLFEHSNNIEQTLSNLKPKVFWKDKNSYIIQFNRWKNKDLNKIIKDLNQVELSLKSKSQINKNILFKMFLVSTCGLASI